jgi:hypothetical protein
VNQQTKIEEAVFSVGAAPRENLMKTLACVIFIYFDLK